MASRRWARLSCCLERGVSLPGREGVFQHARFRDHVRGTIAFDLALLAPARGSRVLVRLLRGPRSDGSGLAVGVAADRRLMQLLAELGLQRPPPGTLGQLRRRQAASWPAERCWHPAGRGSRGGRRSVLRDPFRQPQPSPRGALSRGSRLASTLWRPRSKRDPPRAGPRGAAPEVRFPRQAQTHQR